MWDDKGNWRLRRLDVYRDTEKKAHSFPPPNASVQRFIDEECISSGLVRGEYDDSLPDWVGLLVRQQRGVGSTAPAPALVPRLTPTIQRRREITPPRRVQQKRVSPESEQITMLKGQQRVLQAQLASAL